MQQIFNGLIGITREGRAIDISQIKLARGKKGPSSQVEEWYEKYYPVVFRHVAYLTGNVNDAGDIAQEVFVRLLKTPPSHSNVQAWLVKVATNLTYNFVRDQKGKRRTTPVEDCEVVSGISVEELAIQNVEVRLTRKVLALLNERDRMCLLLKFSGYKYHEIAAALTIEKASVGTILARAQEKFKALYLKEVRER